MIKVAFTMIHYPVAMGRYFLEALLRRADVEVWSAGPYSGRFIPWNNGMHLPQSYVLEPDHPLPISAQSISYAALAQHVPWEPDLWLEVNAGLKSPDRPAQKFAVVGTDPHVLQYNDRRAKADKFFCMQTPYLSPGDIWLPYAYDPVIHYPSPVKWADRTKDVSLIGLQYAQRIEFFRQAAARGRTTHLTNGEAYGDATAVYHQTRVGFNWSSMEDTTARVFELMAFGLCPLLNRVPDLQTLFTEDKHYLGFSNMTEALDKLDWALTHPVEAQEMGRQAREAVLPHTWDARVDTILKEMGLA